MHKLKLRFNAKGLIILLTCIVLSGLLSTSFLVLLLSFLYIDFIHYFNQLLHWTPFCLQTLSSKGLMYLYIVGSPKTGASYTCISQQALNKGIIAYILYSFFGGTCVLIMFYSFLKQQTILKKMFDMCVISSLYSGILILLYIITLTNFCLQPQYGLLTSLMSAYNFWPGQSEGKNYNTDDQFNPYCFRIVASFSYLLCIPISYYTGYIVISIMDFKEMRVKIQLCVSIWMTNILQILLNNYFPSLYLPPTSDLDKFYYRIIFLTFITEFISYVARNAISNLQVEQSKALTVLIFSESFSSLYSRFLVNTISSTELLAALSVIVSFIDFISKTSQSYRDKLLQKLLNKIRGRQITNGSVALNITVFFTVSKCLLENSSIITTSAFYALLLIPDGCLRSSRLPSYDNYRLATIGFNVIHTISVNCVIQISVDSASIIILFLYDALMSNNIVSKEINKDIMHLYVPSVAFSALYSFMFYMIMFEFPRLYQNTNNFNSINQVDLQFTWIYYIPKVVQSSYVVAWLQEINGKF